MKKWQSFFTAGLSLFFCVTTVGAAANEVPDHYHKWNLKTRLEPLPGLLIYDYVHTPSDLEVFLVPQTGKSDVVAYVTAFNVGSRFEVKGRTGLAHLFEHLMFRGTEHFPNPFQTLSEWGDSFNAYTSLDHTLYHELVPKVVFDEVARFESERMRKLLITREGFNTERGAVVSERKMKAEDSPFGRLNWEIYQNFFDVHPYKTEPLGWQEDLDATTYEDALNFYKKFYAPNRAKIAIVGDVTVAEALKVLDRHYGKFASEKFVEPVVPQEPARKDYRRKIIPMKSESVIFEDAVNGLTFQDPRVPAESLMCTLLADQKMGFLAKELIESGLAHKVGDDCSTNVDPGIAGIMVVANPGVDLKKIESTYDKVIKNFAAFVTPAHVEKVKLFYLADQWNTLRNPVNLAEQIARGAAIEGGPLYEFELLDRIKKITAPEVRAVWNDWWSTRAHMRLIIQPSDHTLPVTRTKK